MQNRNLKLAIHQIHSNQETTYIFKYTCNNENFMAELPDATRALAPDAALHNSDRAAGLPRAALPRGSAREPRRDTTRPPQRAQLAPGVLPVSAADVSTRRLMTLFVLYM